MIFFKGRGHKQTNKSRGLQQTKAHASCLMESLGVGTKKKSLESLRNQDWGKLKRTGWNTPEGVIYQAPRSCNPSKEADMEPSVRASSQEDVNKGVSEGCPPGMASPQLSRRVSAVRLLPSGRKTPSSLREKGPTDTDRWRSLWESRI